VRRERREERGGEEESESFGCLDRRPPHVWEAKEGGEREERRKEWGGEKQYVDLRFPVGKHFRKKLLV
jgi:hypothetical protein